MFEDQHAVLVSMWTRPCHVAQRMPDADIKDKDDKTPGVTARDSRLVCALESFESALVAGREGYDPRVWPEAD